MDTHSLDHAKKLDASDPLAGYRQQFLITDPDLIYMDGNSLGRMPKAAAQLGEDLIRQQWAGRLIRGWGEGWMEMPARIGNKIAGLIGANPGEVLLADSTSVNLYKLASAALEYQSGRTKIITDNMNFPSDIYILCSVIEGAGGEHRLEIIPSSDEIHGPEDTIFSALDEDTALMSLSLTTFKSGYTYDLERITQAAHAVGALVLWDLSHSAGSITVDLSAAQADLAVGCTYKYLNGGPGAPAFLYARQDLQHRMHNPIAGWMGHQNMFDFGLDYQPETDIRRMLTGTPTILSGSLVEPGVDMLLEAGMPAVREKSVLLTEYFIELAREYLLPLGFTINSPLDANQRGSHVSLGHPEGLRIDKALIDRYKVIPDFRAPDNIRFGFAPLYTTFVEVHQTVAALKQIVEMEVYLEYSQDKPTVT